MLGRRNEIDRERELNTLYTMIASEKEKLHKMKGALITITLWCCHSYSVNHS